MNLNNKIFYKIISVDWQEVLLAYDLGDVGFITVTLNDQDNNMRTWKSNEGTGCGRLKLDKLNSNSHYTGTFSSDYGTYQLGFTTLQKPDSEMTGSFVLIADPHLSSKNENRKGRFMVESKMIFQDVITQCNQLNPDFVLLPGDITNNAELNEFEASAEIMNQLTSDYIAIPGNHDVQCKSNNPYNLWKQFFGASDGIFDTTHITIIALDTACGYLTDTSALLLEKALKENQKKPLLIITHFQLFDNEKVCRGGAQKVISNANEYSALLKQLTETPIIIYAGHQNIPAVKRIGKALQINIPQPTQYPCGFIYVRCYGRIFYHTFKPISSEIMRQWSRRIGDLSSKQYSETQWDSDYREGKNIDETDFIVTL